MYCKDDHFFFHTQVIESPSWVLLILNLSRAPRALRAGRPRTTQGRRTGSRAEELEAAREGGLRDRGRRGRDQELRRALPQPRKQRSPPAPAGRASGVTTSKQFKNLPNSSSDRSDEESLKICCRDLICLKNKKQCEIYSRLGHNWPQNTSESPGSESTGCYFPELAGGGSNIKTEHTVALERNKQQHQEQRCSPSP